MSSKDSVGGTIRVALILCVICSVFISSAAVILKPFQENNKTMDRNKNILIAAGMFNEEINTNADIDTLFAEFTPRIVDLEAAQFATPEQLADLNLDPLNYDQRIAHNDPELSEAVVPSRDIAAIKRRVQFAVVYIIEDANGGIETIVLPVSGYGLWGTMYGYLALEGDANTVVGIGFYEQKETPGLGGEVTNPAWIGLWPGKKIYDADGDVALSVVKGSGDGEYEIDGLAGASLTSRGIANLIEFWMGPDGFGPFLDNVRES